MYAGAPKIAQELFFWSYHLKVGSSYWRKYFAVEKHGYVQLYTSVSIPRRKSWEADILRECSSPTMCHMSHVMCHKVVELVGGGSVINGAYPES